MNAIDELYEFYYNVDCPFELKEYIDRVKEELVLSLARPVDAEGVPWFLEEITKEGDVVIGFELDRHSNWNIIVYTPGAYTRTLLANQVYHYKRRTVETLLKEMLRDYDSEEDFDFYQWVHEFQGLID